MQNHITPPDNCTGCGLCANVCSKDAIEMVWSKDGFLVPQVDTEKCVNCGLCVKQCIALAIKPECSDEISGVVAYGGWHKDAGIHLNSSSGGIFTALAEQVILQSGIIMAPNFKTTV